MRYLPNTTRRCSCDYSRFIPANIYGVDHTTCNGSTAPVWWGYRGNENVILE